MQPNTLTRVAPDIRPGGYPVSFAGYPVGRVAGYPVRKTLHGIFFLQNLGLY